MILVISQSIKQKSLNLNMEITGKIIACLEPKGGVSARTGNQWKTQDYVIETMDQFPKKCVFNVFGEDKIAQFNIQAGDTLTVSFDINAREWNGRWFNDLRAWKVEHVDPAQAQAMAGGVPPMSAAPGAFPPPSTGDTVPFPQGDSEEVGSSDDLPF